MLERLNGIAASLRSPMLALLFSACVAGSATAQVTVDIGEVTCNQFALYKVSDPETIAVWIHGYYSGKRGNTVVDIEKLKAQAKTLRDYCLQNPDTKVLDAVDTLLKTQ